MDSETRLGGKCKFIFISSLHPKCSKDQKPKEKCEEETLANYIKYRIRDSRNEQESLPRMGPENLQFAS